MVARQSSASAFGAFSIVFTCYLIVLGATRAVALEPLIVRWSLAPTAKEFKVAAASAVGAAMGIAIAATVASFALAYAASSALAWLFLVLGLGLPGLLLQDCWRYTFYAQRRAPDAAINSLVWTGAQVLVSAALVLLGLTSGLAFVVAWAVGASVAAACGLMQTAIVPAVERGRAWWRTHRELAQYYLAESATVSGANYITVLLLVPLAGLAAVGSLRAAQVLLGPLGVVHVGLMMFAVPEAVRLRHRDTGSFRKLAAGLSGAMAVSTAGWACLLLLVPDHVGSALFGETWQGAQPVLLPIFLAALATSVASGPIVALRALERASLSLRIRLFASLLALGLGVAGATAAGAVGAAFGLAAGGIFASAVWWTYYFRVRL